MVVITMLFSLVDDDDENAKILYSRDIQKMRY